MNKYLITAGVFGFLAVALGAFGAHGLKQIISYKMLETYNTGIFYHLVHSVVLLALALTNQQKFNRAIFAFVVGIILFSFSLYAYAISGVTAFAMITPLGGISLLVGWVFLIIAGIKNK